MKELCYFLLVPLLSSLYYIQNISGVNEVVTLSIYVIIVFVAGLLFYVVIKAKNSIKRIKPSRMGRWIVCLVFIDQVIKVIIYRLNIDGIIWNNIVGIKPIMNKEQMAILNFFKINLPSAIIIFLKVIIVIAILVAFLSIKKKNINCIAIFVLLMASGVATLLDSLIWGYTLDYIYFVGLTCYDIKDFYVDIALGFCWMELTKWIKSN